MLILILKKYIILLQVEQTESSLINSRRVQAHPVIYGNFIKFDISFYSLPPTGLLTFTVCHVF